ncbi:uncharacterized protein G2W53_026800 [Senna tora]|uniref:Uncharacterized protein n=1 Tax=Senna tora TaxID=362788 RepID=A0A834WFE9_9FABA|nr:uncharacterized protein G2W53_026800 [Senna tora]
MLVCEYVIVACNVIIETVICMKIKVNISGSEVGIDTQFFKRLRLNAFLDDIFLENIVEVFWLSLEHSSEKGFLYKLVFYVILGCKSQDATMFRLVSGIDRVMRPKED